MAGLERWAPTLLVFPATCPTTISEMVGGNEGRGAGIRMIMIRPNESVGVGSVVLLEPSALGGEGREGRPSAVLEECALRADEARGCDRRICDRHDRHERE